MAMWLLYVPADYDKFSARVTSKGTKEVVPDTLRWRPATDVLANLHTFRTFGKTALGLRNLLDAASTPC